MVLNYAQKTYAYMANWNTYHDLQLFYVCMLFSMFALMSLSTVGFRPILDQLDAATFPLFLWLWLNMHYLEPMILK